MTSAAPKPPVILSAPATLPWPRPDFPAVCCADKACGRHFARGYRDKSPCGPMGDVDLAKLLEDAHLVYGKGGAGAGGWHSPEMKLARGAIALLAERLAHLPAGRPLLDPAPDAGARPGLLPDPDRLFAGLKLPAEMLGEVDPSHGTRVMLALASERPTIAGPTDPEVERAIEELRR